MINQKCPTPKAKKSTEQKDGRMLSAIKTHHSVCVLGGRSLQPEGKGKSRKYFAL